MPRQRPWTLNEVSTPKQICGPWVCAELRHRAVSANCCPELGMILHKLLFFRLPYVHDDIAGLEREISEYSGFVVFIMHALLSVDAFLASGSRPKTTLSTHSRDGVFLLLFFTCCKVFCLQSLTRGPRLARC